MVTSEGNLDFIGAVNKYIFAFFFTIMCVCVRARAHARASECTNNYIIKKTLRRQYKQCKDKCWQW
jgi:hypothetical protein